MKIYKNIMLVMAALSVSACAGQQMPSRNAIDAPASATALSSPKVDAAKDQAAHVFIPDVSIAKVTVDVPRTLSVSEKNSYYPKGDIVWRGDTFGDRHDQVAAIVSQSAERAAAKIEGTRPVHLHIEVTRFHGLSEKARYSTGGVHNMNFYVTLLDPVTGAVLRPARHVVSNLDALGGTQAVQGDMQGNTQKVRVTGFLEQVIVTEVTQPSGYTDTNAGLFVVLNRQ